jgi:hypothetical protein
VTARRVRVYLAGSVPKGADDPRPTDDYWSEDDERKVQRGICSAAVETLNPNKSGVSRADFYANFGCDLYLVDSSDVVFVDARHQRGIGVGAEMMFAQMRGRRVVVICPENSFYRRRDVRDMFGEDLDEWIHPFVMGLADYIANDVEEAVGWVNGWIQAGCPEKGPRDLDEAISYYQSLAGENNEVRAQDVAQRLRRSSSAS